MQVEGGRSYPRPAGWMLITIFLAMALLAPTLGSAATRAPLLLAVDRQDTFLGSGQLGGGPLHDVRSSLFVQPDGETILSETTVKIGGQELGPNGIVFSGGLGRRALAGLQSMLAASRAGASSDCHTLPRAAFRIVELTWRITWFGRNGRSNSFMVSSLGVGSLPECSPEVDRLVDEILELTRSFEGQAGTRQFISAR
jgi:hypothetical protein